MTTMTQQTAQHLIVAGIPRSGSTSLYTYFAQHPQICASSVKETQHFLPAAKGEPTGDLAEYRRFFAHHENESYLMEASPSYFYGAEKVAQAIRETVGNAKLIIILRDPAIRFFSYFTHEKMFGNIEKDVLFEDFLHSTTVSEELLHSGHYADYLPGWQAHFPNQIKLVYFDDIKQNPGQLMVEICRWLNIDDQVYEGYAFTKENRGALYKYKWLHMTARAINTRFETFLRRNLRLKQFIRDFYYTLNEARDQKPTLRPETKQFLQEYYRPHNERLCRYLLENNYPVDGWLTQYQ